MGAVGIHSQGSITDGVGAEVEGANHLGADGVSAEGAEANGYEGPDDIGADVIGQCRRCGHIRMVSVLKFRKQTMLVLMGSVPRVMALGIGSQCKRCRHTRIGCR
jgi:NAD(P)H-dependent flavin oxidoreductase YrpB (nitropropane dioxygenase family)